MNLIAVNNVEQVCHAAQEDDINAHDAPLSAKEKLALARGQTQAAKLAKRQEKIDEKLAKKRHTEKRNKMAVVELSACLVHVLSGQRLLRYPVAHYSVAIRL